MISRCWWCGNEKIRMAKQAAGWFMVCDRCLARGPIDALSEEACRKWNEGVQRVASH